MAGVLASIDLTLRLLYCAIAPVVLGGFSTQIPVLGIATGATLATLLAVTEGQRWREVVGRVPLLGRPFRGPAKLGAYYREHPPKPLLYYVLYPVLLPYIVFRRHLRAEWRLYRKSGAIALVVTIATATVEYVRHWAPEIPIPAFLVQFAVIMVMQMLLTMVVIMPLVTTIVIAHARPRRRWVRTLAVLVALGTALTAAILIKQKHVPSTMVDTRIRYRASVDKKRTLNTLGNAAFAAVQLIPADHPEGMVTGRPLAAARAELRKLWKADEVELFGVWTSPTPVRLALVLEVDKRHPAIAFAVGIDGKVVPPGAISPAGQAVLAAAQLPAK